MAWRGANNCARICRPEYARQPSCLCRRATSLTYSHHRTIMWARGVQARSTSGLSAIAKEQTAAMCIRLIAEDCASLVDCRRCDSHDLCVYQVKLSVYSMECCRDGATNYEEHTKAGGRIYTSLPGFQVVERKGK